MPRILLIRHASHDLLGRELVGRRSGVTLSRAGSAEAEALAERLAQHPISVVYASPRERAIETAKPIAERHRLDVQIAPELDEVDFGTWTGLSFTELDKDPLWHRFNGKRAITRVPGGESMAEVAARMTAIIKKSAVRQGAGEIAIVGHGDPLRIAVVSLLGLPIEAMLRLEIAPASLSILRIDGAGEPKLELLNDRSHCDLAFSAAHDTARTCDGETCARPMTQARATEDRGEERSRA
ncbi:MAG: histidine phosphatase family protein [Bradyrhizobium sp.]